MCSLCALSPSHRVCWVIINNPCTLAAICLSAHRTGSEDAALVSQVLPLLLAIADPRTQFPAWPENAVGQSQGEGATQPGEGESAGDDAITSDKPKPVTMPFSKVWVAQAVLPTARCEIFAFPFTLCGFCDCLPRVPALSNPIR